MANGHGLAAKRVVGAAIALTPSRQQGIALLGPVAVDQEFRRQGIATLLINRLCDDLARQEVASVYLAVKHHHSARALYHQLGFQNDQGIVMRRLFNDKKTFDENYFSFSTEIKIRKADWSDYCGVQLLVITPAEMICFDYQRGLFSSRTCEPTRFLSVFPDLMKRQAKNRGLTHVLVSGASEKVMGLAQIGWSAAAPLRHMGTLDFFVTDPFIRYGEELVSQTIEQARKFDVQRICCYVPQADRLKRQLLEQLGATLLLANAAHLPFWIHCGSQDKVISPVFSRQIWHRANQLGLTHWKFTEHPDRGHSFSIDWPEVEKWLLKQKRITAPSEITFITHDPHARRVWWLEILAAQNPKSPARITAKIQGQSIALKTSNISRYQLHLADAPLDATSPITIVENGRLFSISTPNNGPLTLSLPLNLVQ